MVAGRGKSLGLRLVSDSPLAQTSALIALMRRDAATGIKHAHKLYPPFDVVMFVPQNRS